MKTALGLAQAECANYQAGLCIGLDAVVPIDDWIETGRGYDTRCLLSKPGPAERHGQEPIECRSATEAIRLIKTLPNKGEGFRLCRYFEKAVLPLARKVSAYQGAAIEYNAEEIAQGKLATEILSDRECECGKPLLPRQRACPACQKRKARQAKREKVNGKDEKTKDILAV